MKTIESVNKFTKIAISPIIRFKLEMIVRRELTDLLAFILQFINKFNVVYDRHGVGRRMRGLLF